MNTGQALTQTNGQARGEAEQVLAVPDITTTAGLRDRAIIETFYGTGIRRAELAHLNLRDLDVERRTLTVRQGKGRKDRMIPIGQRALAWIDHYLTESRPRLTGADDDGTVFLTFDGTGFSLDRLTQLVRDHVTASGVGKQGACHLFRHTLATLMLEGGADIRYIQAMLGHAELSTTQIYTQVSIRALQAVHTATFPAATTHTRHGPGLVHHDHDDDGATPRVSASQLLAALDQEIEEENRAHPGSPGQVDPSPLGK
jgi:integrase/recombinase XerD